MSAICLLAVRAAAAFSKSLCVLFTIPKDAYVAMRDSEEKTGDLSDDVRFLSSLPWLADARQDATVRLALRSHKREHSKGTMLVAEGSSKCVRRCGTSMCV